MLEIGNVRASMSNNGVFFRRGDDHLYEVPKDGGVDAVFFASLWVGGMVGDSLRFAGAFWGEPEFWAGPLEWGGAPPTNCAQYDRIWTVSRDDVEVWERSGVASWDLRDWPTGLGAPTVDVTGRKIIPQGYDARLRKIDLSAGERPLILGDQMSWWVMNDQGGVHESSETPPIGLEVRVSAFAFRSAGALGNSTFYRLELKKPFGAPLDSAYMALFFETELGNFHDDYVGSDSILGLAYTYNADNDDGPSGYGVAPPALGVDLLQGPLAEVDGWDSNRDGRIDEEGERLPMTSVWFKNYDAITISPLHGAEHMYNIAQGRDRWGRVLTAGGHGSYFPGGATTWIFSGTPGEYWSEGFAWPEGWANNPSDRWFVAGSGPFSLSAESPQEIVFGVLTSFGEDNLDSVRKLKEDDRFIQELADNGLFRPEMPRRPAPPETEFTVTLYPNPVSETASLRYSIPMTMDVQIDLLDTLGRRKQTVVSGSKEAGSYQISLLLSDLSPGVYMLRIHTDHLTSGRPLVLVR